MPLEIKELHIRVTVNQPQGESGSPPASAAGSEPAANPEALLQQCIEQVMDMINAKIER